MIGIERRFFDEDIHEGFFFPEKIAEWYGEYIVIYSTIRTSGYFISVLDKDLDIIWKKLSGGPFSYFIKRIEMGNYISSSVNNMICVNSNTVDCWDVKTFVDSNSDDPRTWPIWKTSITDEEIRVDQSTYSLDGNNVVVDIDATTRAGEKKKYHLVLNKDTGELVNPQS